MQLHYQNVERTLTMKKNLRKSQVLDIVNTMCSMRRFTASWTNVLFTIGPIAFCIKCCYHKRNLR